MIGVELPVALLTKDIISLIAPRLFIAVNGDQAHIFPYSGAKKVINDAKQDESEIHYSAGIPSKNLDNYELLNSFSSFSKSS